MKKIILPAILLLAIFAYSDCKKQEKKTGRITVVVSVFPLCDIARNISGDRADVFFTIPAGADPHTFEPRPSIAKDLQKADLFIGVSKEFDGWLERYLPDTAVRTYLLDRSYRRDKPGNSTIDTPNPHIWLSVRNAKNIARSTARYLSETDRKNKNYYDLNLTSYLKKLDELDRSIALLYMNKKNKSFIQWHEAWNYFADDYGLAITGTVQREGSDKASVRSIKEIIDRAKRDQVTVIVVGLSAEAKAALVLASEIAGTVVPLDGIGAPQASDRSDYLKLMYYNAKTLADAMQ